MSQRNHIRRHLLLLLPLLLLGVGTPSDPDIAARVTAVSKHVMCMCKDNCNKVLINCNCSYSDQFRAEIAELVRSGKSDDEIVQQFIDRYGEIVLAAPTTEGFNLTAWVLPFLMLLAGATVLFLVLRRWKRQIAATPPQGDTTTAHGGAPPRQEEAETRQLGEKLEKALEDFDY